MNYMFFTVSLKNHLNHIGSEVEKNVMYYSIINKLLTISSNVELMIGYLFP